MKLSERWLGWLAAFIEGEGTFRGGPNDGGGIAVTACQVQCWPLERLVDILGGRITWHQRGIWHWGVYGSNAVALMMTLYALMSPDRQGQIRTALAGWRLRKLHPRDRRACPRGHPYHRTRDGRRRCRACDAAKALRVYYRKRAAAA